MKLWVGDINGQLVVYDPELQQLDSDWVLLYFRMHNRCVAYLKNHARSLVKEISEDHQEYAATINSFNAWTSQQTSVSIKELQDDLIKRQAGREKWKLSLEEKHKARLDKAGLPSRGLVQSKGSSEARVTVCYSCHKAISSDLNLCCSVCNWILCGNCAACGCEYHR